MKIIMDRFTNVNYNIPHNTANELLHILKNHSLLELPNDVRSLLRTSQNMCMHIKSTANIVTFHLIAAT